MRTLLALSLFVLIVGSVYADNQEHGGSRGGGGSVAHAAPAARGGGHISAPSARPTARPSVITRMQRYTVPHPQPIQHPSSIVHDNAHIAWPQRGPHGSPITQQPARVPPAQHNAIARNHAFVNNIHARERTETTPNHFYWHDENGRRYAHYFNNGIHWYGFYHGSQFYWTRYYTNRWWWYDPHFARWVFWWDGYWWWPGPLGVDYVYMNNSYYPYENGEVVVAQPEVVPPPAETPNPQTGQTYNSPDGQRMVQIVGDQSDAYLYDQSSGQPSYLKYLGPNAASVKFSGGADGNPPQILINYKDGTFALFDENGDSAQTPPASAAELPGAPPAVTAPPPPDSTPPAPSSTPAQ